jgi:DNA-binding NtrC family response regulator
MSSISGQLQSVLIVDDDEDTGASLFDCFDDEGFDVMVAKDPQTALHLASRHPYQVALLDLHMPGLNGLQLFARMRKTAPQLVGILMTGQPGHDTASSARQIGFSDVLGKPVEFSDLLHAVHAAFQSTTNQFCPD